MKTIKLLLGVLLLCVFSTTQAQWWPKKIKGNGTMATEVRELNPYETISVNGSIYVTLTSGKEGSITLEAEENLLEYIEIINKNGNLRIRTKDQVSLRTSHGKGIKINIPVTEVSKLELNGSGDIEGTFPLNTNQLKLSVNGSGDIEVNVSVEKLKAAVAGSGDIDISGEAKEFNAAVTGSGDIDAKALKATICKATVTGSGDISLYASEQLISKIVGSGDIHVNKSVKIIEKKVVGSGDLNKY